MAHLRIWSSSRTSIFTFICSKRFLILVQKGQVVLEKTMTLLAATIWSTISMGVEAMGAMVAKLRSWECGFRRWELPTERSGRKQVVRLEVDWDQTSAACCVLWSYQDGQGIFCKGEECEWILSSDMIKFWQITNLLLPKTTYWSSYKVFY